ncbi:MAG: VOC family protein [Sphingomonadales bacterium]
MTIDPLLATPLVTPSRRGLLHSAALGLLGAAMPGPAVAQGLCQNGFETKACPLPIARATAPISPVFARTGWRTVALDHITFEVPDYRREAAFYIALMGWTLRSDDGAQAILDIGRWGTVVLKSAPQARQAQAKGFCFVIAPWDARAVEAALLARGLNPVRDNDGNGFESFHVKDPDGFDLQICNRKGLAAGRRGARPVAAFETPAPFEATGWQTVWLDHFSFRVSNYKETASFYTNLLGWEPIYDEGSQVELKIGEVGDIIVRGGNPFDPGFKRDAPRAAFIDHISFGIAPWDTDAVKAALAARKLFVRIDTSTPDEIHVAPYKSYHTFTPGYFDLQISFVNRRRRFAQANAVRPKALELR